jgi:hypothetical protein
MTHFLHSVCIKVGNCFKILRENKLTHNIGSEKALRTKCLKEKKEKLLKRRLNMAKSKWKS